VDPVAYRHLADAAGRLGHADVAREALLRHAVLVGDLEVADAVSP
jgi:hypothetical protein